MDVFPSCKEKVEALRFELEHRQKENESLRFMLGVMTRRFSILQAEIQETEEHQQKTASNLADGDQARHEILDSNKRARFEVPITKASRILVRSHSNDKSLIVKDGYQWRKYGQKVTKDNPSPRAYFRCSMAPNCPVKKKVQRCVEDDSVLVASYDGEHNHEPNGSHGQYLCSPHSSSSKISITNHVLKSPIEIPPLQPSIALDLTLSSPSNQQKEKPSKRSMEDCGKINYNYNKNYIEEYIPPIIHKYPTPDLALLAGKFQHPLAIKGRKSPVQRDTRPVWYPSVFRWPEFGFSMPSSSIFRWPEFDFSYFTTRLSLESFRWLDFSIDDVWWTFVTVLESVALAAMLCYFFVFCGCTL